jgi:hypothetical protein
LAEAGLARADRVRLFTINTAADGIVLATVGGGEAIEAAGVSGVLLAARLAVPVIPAAMDVPGSVATALERLHYSGAVHPALAPLLIGPEAPLASAERVATEVGCPTAEPLGAYPAIGRLVLQRYLAALGVTLPAPRSGPTVD